MCACARLVPLRACVDVCVRMCDVCSACVCVSVIRLMYVVPSCARYRLSLHLIATVLLLPLKMWFS